MKRMMAGLAWSSSNGQRTHEPLLLHVTPQVCWRPGASSGMLVASFVHNSVLQHFVCMSVTVPSHCAEGIHQGSGGLLSGLWSHTAGETAHDAMTDQGTETVPLCLAVLILGCM